MLDSSLSTDAANLGLLKKRPHPQNTVAFWNGELTRERKRGSLVSQILAMNSIDLKEEAHFFVLIPFDPQVIVLYLMTILRI